VGIVAVVHVSSLALMHHFRGQPLVAHWSLLSLLAVCLVVAGLVQLRSGVSPLSHLRERLAAVRDGRVQRLEGSYPAEVEPLVQDLNALLDHRDRVIRRAQAKAGDLAHGLKTPLAVLAQEAERARAAGQHELAESMDAQIARMRQQVDYHLAHARAAASGATLGARCALGESVEGLRRALLRLHAERGIGIDVNVAPDHSVRAEREDVDEMLGNLLDNACKWAKSRVSVTSSVTGDRVRITVDDDGGGLDPSKRESVLQRGVRADEAAPGSGFGLAIVRDLVELYGGSITLETSPLGGLRARLELSAA
jgi:signal transduction histidine kinase